jgi:hypothetical protein
MREIIESDEFKNAVRALGGHRAIDEALEPLIEALYLNPYGFEFFQNDWVTFRYARTRAIELVPALVVMFTIAPNGDVILEHVEEDQDATRGR